ncbi:hypothetical protein CKO51_05755 [Rhodopirellula sp. SM50]|nr:hypothetical protein CKO51_05755 [Rhodopirellula sp. SM50]
MVIADHVYQDRKSGKSVIAGTFTKIIFQPLLEQPPEDKEKNSSPDPSKGHPAVFSMGSPHMYLALTGIRKELELDIRLMDLADARVLMEGGLPIKVEDANPIAVHEYAVPLPRLPLPRKSGNYSIDVLWNGEQLASWRIDATMTKPDQPTEP